MNNFQDAIKQALTRNVDLSKEEYAAKMQEADKSTKTHGVEGEAPLTEAERHARIQSNFYGTLLNYMAALLGEITETNALLDQIIKEMEDAGRKNE